MATYDKYKKSGFWWIGDIPEHWGTIRIKHYCRSISSGATPSTRESSFWDGDIPWIPSGECHDCDIRTAPKFITKEGMDSCSTRLIPANTALMAMTGATCAKVGYLTMEACTNQSVMSYVENSKKAYSRFLFYVLIGVRDYVLTHQTGGAQAGINGEDCSNLIVPHVPHDEQKLIADYLDSECSKIDALLTQQENRVRLLQEARRSIISNTLLFGLNKNCERRDPHLIGIDAIPAHWEVRQLKYLTRSEPYAIKTGPFGTQLKGEDLQPDGDVRVYNQRNVIDDQFETVQFYVDSAKAKELESFYTKPGDILITSRGTIGRCAILPDDAEMGILHPCLIAIRLNQKKYCREWLKYYINDSGVFETNVFLNSNATTIDVIYTGTLKSIKIPVPPYEEQLQMVEYINTHTKNLDKAIKNVSLQIDYLKEYKQSLITEVVTGKRKVC